MIVAASTTSPHDNLGTNEPTTLLYSLYPSIELEDVMDVTIGKVHIFCRPFDIFGSFGSP